MLEFDVEVDASGLNCPLPLLQTKQALAAMRSGQLLQVIATDPGALKDFQSFCKQTGHRLEKSDEQAGKWHFYVRKR